ncbi:phosphohydrolase [Deinococcus sp. YIM 77859]|uniref:HD domain-containing protein n=1 Tax=Deinococcus sp. YIM 77859 TaxID=1540221 RepID=UPI0005510815|nr:phosphohydrolase [Deinococcus sp. YIM 77859]
MPDAALLARAEAFARPFYTQAYRVYHTAAHIEAVLSALRSRQVLTPALTLAAWGHDLVYDPQRLDNEERSAEVFGAWLRGQGIQPELEGEVRALILATRHAAPPATRGEALLVDADLSILGANPEAFAAYDAAIRQEYAFVPEEAYRVRRARVLQGFLNRERIFTTPEFAELEERARVNLNTALQNLG